jgi:hypothetical protein
LMCRLYNSPDRLCFAFLILILFFLVITFKEFNYIKFNFILLDTIFKLAIELAIPY